MARSNKKLTPQAQAFAVQALACFDSPATVAAAVRKEFATEITPQSIEAYDPTKRAGRLLAKKWVTLFEATRADFIKSATHIGVAHRTTRLRAIQRMADRAETQGNLDLAARLLEQAAKEMGDSYTNRHKLEHTGAGGGPVQVQRIERVIVRPPNSNT